LYNCGMMRPAPIIAIDGPAGSGKSTAARNLARLLGFTYIDTGAMYRAATWSAVRAGIPLDDETALAEHIAGIRIELEPDTDSPRVFVDGRDVSGEIRSENISREVHHIAGSAACRSPIVRQQKRMGERGGVVAEGRDIGTVVFPDAEVKIFLVADLRERARRRQAQLAELGEHAELDDIMADMQMRDERDSRREASPLKKADDAVEVDTTHLSVEEMTRTLAALVLERFPNLAAAERRTARHGT